MTGVMYNEKSARIVAWIVFFGFNMVFFIQFIMGVKGMPRRYARYDGQFQFYHVISTVGTWVLFIGFLWMGYYLLRSLKHGRKAPDNPWGGLTLEWKTTSPPPVENFLFQPSQDHDPYDYGNHYPEGYDDELLSKDVGKC